MTYTPIFTEVPSGFMKRTTNLVYGGGDVTFLSGFTITGDGVTPVRLQVHIPNTDMAAGTGVAFYLRDSAGPTQVGGATASGNGGSYGWSNVNMEAVVPAFTGTKNFYVNVATTSGAGLTVTSNAASPSWMRATWAPGFTVTV